MVNDVLSSGVLSHFATIGLVIFVAVFVGVGIWTLTRSRREIDDWSHLPLSGDDEAPLDDRSPSNGTA